MEEILLTNYITYELPADCSNNQAEYEFFILGLKILLMEDAKSINFMGNSQIIIKQLIDEYQWCHLNSISLYESTAQLLRQFMDAKILYIAQDKN